MTKATGGEAPALLINPEQERVVAPGQRHPIIPLLDRMGAAEIFGDPISSRRFWQETSFVVAERFLMWANGAIRGTEVNGKPRVIPSTERGYSMGRMVLVRPNEEFLSGQEVTYIAPTRQQARQLFREVWNAARGVEDDARASVLLGLGITLVHNFPFANGRAARLAYSLRYFGYDGSEVAGRWLSELLVGGVKARSKLNLTPRRAQLPEKFTEHRTRQILTDAGYIGVPLVVKDIDAVEIRAINPESKQHQDMVNALMEYQFNVPLMLEIIVSHGHKIEDYVDSDGNIDARLVIDRLVPKGTPHAAEDVVTRQQTMKMDYIRSIVRCLADGDESIFGSPDAIAALYIPGNIKLMANDGLASAASLLAEARARAAELELDHYS